MIRLLIADDHGIMREGLKRLFVKEEGIVVAGEAANGNQVLDAVKTGGFDLLLLDMSMPEPSGVELIEMMRTLAPKLPILVLSMHHEPQIIKRALNAGADGYISKDTNDPERLVAAVREVAAGGRYLDPATAERFAFDTINGAVPLHAALSKREMQILNLLVHGMGVNEIANMLFISSKTVSTHKIRLMEKMNMKTNAELVSYALSHGLMG